MVTDEHERALALLCLEVDLKDVARGVAFEHHVRKLLMRGEVVILVAQNRGCDHFR